MLLLFVNVIDERERFKYLKSYFFEINLQYNVTDKSYLAQRRHLEDFHILTGNKNIPFGLGLEERCGDIDDEI